MKEKKILYRILALLLALTAILAAIRLGSMEEAPEGAVKVIWQNQTLYLTTEDITRTPVKGDLVNGKGETVAVDTQGILLANAFSGLGIDPVELTGVTVSADDAYTAEISGEELMEEGKVYLTLDGEDIRLVVFGDKNSRRHVRKVVSLEVR